MNVGAIDVGRNYHVIMKTMGDRIRHARKAKKITQKALAELLEINRVSVTQWELNDTKPELHRLPELVRILGGTVEWYLSGKGEFFVSDAPIDDRGQNEPDAVAGDVQQFNIHGALGGGGALSVMLDEGSRRTIDPEESDGFWTFPESVKTGMRNLAKIYALPVRGDSMEPTLPGGSIAFVDVSQNFPQPEDIYALDAGDGLIVKRLKLAPRTENILVISDNERYGTDELHRQDVQVYGRVVGWFQWRN